MADNETITDIIAWLRRPREGENAYLTLWRDEIADRLEAAHRRERGDAAKLREALSKFCAYSAVVLNTGMFNRVPLEALLNMAKAALAAPPRNCDKYSHDEALQVWALERGNEHNGCFDEWLYEIAKKGDEK